MPTASRKPARPASDRTAHAGSGAVALARLRREAIAAVGGPAQRLFVQNPHAAAAHFADAPRAAPAAAQVGDEPGDPSSVQAQAKKPNVKGWLERRNGRA